MRVKPLALVLTTCFSLKTALAAEQSQSIAQKAILNNDKIAVPGLVTP